ncbi:hypothetical protein KKE19_04585 [Patescibacteria group bacterium]|nr:hypothetical protein [Patescibacteria group bacterium]MBU4275056.1 hypothetical protein [Patescibacteria group bacterium]MBU4367489.1 hypothetical protein [Patescibacteria group bacterium]MBU4462022.1 hypothetical protein [Patescibacteria group bacterium]MCG2700481.1 hypothetical protein [Candidatus Parcubacteria bacterium]
MAYKNKEKELQNKKEYYRKNREKILEYKKRYYQKNKEKINKKVQLYGKKWYQRNIKKIRLRHREYYRKDKERILQYHKKHYRKNKEKVSQRSKKYYQKNKGKIQLRRKKYNQKNKQKLLRYKKLWQKHKRKVDFKYRLDENMGSAISRSLKGRKNGQKWEVLVGYTLEKLIGHLEKQLDHKMNWDNYGNYWAVDHIKPKSLFIYNSPNDLEFRQCWSFKNLQPLEKIENIKKRNYYTEN